MQIFFFTLFVEVALQIPDNRKGRETDKGQYLFCGNLHAIEKFIEIMELFFFFGNFPFLFEFFYAFEVVKFFLLFSEV